MKIYRSLSITVVCLILGITLSWQYQSIRQNSSVSSLNAMRKEQLYTELLLQKERNENLKVTNSELEERVKKLISIKGDDEETNKEINDEIQKYKTIAGLTSVKGKGVLVTFSKEDAQMLSEDEILYVLNEFRATDAKAIAINDERIIASSEIRVAGSYAIVNGKQINPPYVLKAIGDPVNLENALNMLGGAMDLIRAFAKDTKIEKSNEIIIPKVRDEVIKTDKLTVVDKAK